MAQGPEVATYTNEPENVPQDRVRLEVGDTDCAVAFLTDAEIKLCMADEPNSVLRAAAKAAGLIAAKLARRINFSHGPVKKDASQAYDHYVDLQAQLDRKASIEGAVPEALGVTIAEKETADEDTSRVQPDFKKGMMDNPRSGDAILNDPNRPITY
ncbi:MAG: hypothetical protein GY898_06130 [Proteobacteria bacterium]|nr:hypothetical protein [Pseudomonadota bacterium]